jgi:drug/metabolite transporter (DMT)-like permease
VKIVAAFLVLYLVWGSTYLAVKFAVEDVPPMLMSGLRFIIAGTLLLAWTARKGSIPRPAWRHDLTAGLLLIGLTYALVTWGQQHVASGITAIIAASVPIWMVVGERLLGRRPPALTYVGVAIGFAGLAVLVLPELRNAGATAMATGAIVLSNVTWTIGTLVVSDREDRGRDLLAATAYQMLIGGGFNLAAAAFMGELGRADWSSISRRAWFSWGYLVFAGSIAGFTAYTWLLSKVSATRVATHGFVNPVVAVLLGWWLAGEQLSWRTAVAVACVMVALWLILRRSRKP